MLQQLGPFQPKRWMGPGTSQALLLWGCGQGHAHSHCCPGRRWQGWVLARWGPGSPSAQAGSTTLLTSGPRAEFGPEAPEQSSWGAQ